MLGLHTSISGLRANQVAIDTIASNIANANTPDYHRQRVELNDRQGFLFRDHIVGTGVQIGRISRAFNFVLEASITENHSRLAGTDAAASSLRQIETALGPGEGSLHRRLENFFNQLESLATEPDDLNTRRIALADLQAVTGEFGLVSSRLRGIEQDTRQQIRENVDGVNQQFEQIFALNDRIRTERRLGREPNDLLDQFQQKVNAVAEVIDLQVHASDDQGYAFQFGSGGFYFDASKFSLEVVEPPNGPIEVRVSGSNTAINFGSGTIAAQQNLVNQRIPGIRSELETLSSTFAFELDRVHSTGLGLNNGFEFLNSVRAVSDSTSPLNDVIEFGPLRSGNLYVSVTEEATGQRELVEIAFDPGTESLSDLANRIDGIANLQGQVSGVPPQISIGAANGFRFDFAGRLDTVPDASGVTGTSVPSADGVYTGPRNDEFEYRVIGNGTVGVTDGLQLEVSNSQGEVLGNFEIGAGYEPGSVISIGDGVEISLSAGTVNDGDSFSTKVVAQADETGVLAAIGLNSLFTGSTPDNLQLNPQLEQDPSLFALGRSGNVADASNLDRLVSLRSQNLVDRQSSFEVYLERINIQVAQEVQTITIEQTSLELIDQQLARQRDSLSGVDPNEEITFLLQFQRSYEASVRVISTIDQMMAELVNMVR